MYLPWNAVLHKVPDKVSAELAGLVTPMSNGIEWALIDAGVGYNTTVLIQGPGQQGLSQTVACHQAGASNIIVTGTSRDAVRLDMARQLGAHHVIDVQTQDAPRGDHGRHRRQGRRRGPRLHRRRRRDPHAARHRRAEAARRHPGGAGGVTAFPDFPLAKVTEKGITIKSARGHSYHACELALEQLASDRYPLDLLTTHTFGLGDVDLAIRSVGGEGEEGVIHANLLPWKDRAA
jgi:threonine dehydrogenase-like Zn-dependent dehydrogenase